MGQTCASGHCRLSVPEPWYSLIDQLPARRAFALESRAVVSREEPHTALRCDVVCGPRAGEGCGYGLFFRSFMNQVPSLVFTRMIRAVGPCRAL